MALTKITTPELFDFSDLNTALQLPSGTTAQRPSAPTTGEWRFNTDDKFVEYYDGTYWVQIETDAIPDPDDFPSQNFNVNTYFGTSSTQIINAKFNEAANFNGSSSRIDITSPIGQSLSNENDDFSVSLWVNFNSITSSVGAFNGAISGNINGSTYSSFAIYAYGHASGLSLAMERYFNNTGYYYSSWTTAAPFAAVINTWYNIVTTYVGSTKTVTHYVDGTSVGSYTLDTNAGARTMNPQNSFGSYNGSSSGLAGKLEQIRIFNTTLTAGEAEDCYTDETTTTAATLDFPVGAGCVAAYQLDGDASDVGGTYGGVETSIGYTGLNFQPDFVWIKRRDGTENNYLQDSVRGSTQQIYTNSTATEFNETTAITSFIANGFEMGVYNGINNSTEDYVAWCWKAGGAPSTDNVAGAGVVPTAGSVKINGANSTVADAGTTAVTRQSVNTKAGFSITTYTAAGGYTVSHGLSSAPDLIIIKALNTAGTPIDWLIYNSIDGTGKYMSFTESGGTGGAQTRALSFSSVTSTTFTDNWTGDSLDWVAYSFKNVDGYQRVSTYTGSGSATGNYVYTTNDGTASGTDGFEPAFLMIKKATASTTGDWMIIDNKRSPANPRAQELFPNLNLGENDLEAVDFYTNGFELATTDTDYNDSGITYLYWAIAANKDTSVPTQANSFSPTLYTGTGSSLNVFTPNKPNFTWIKGRDTVDFHSLFDNLRGAQVLSSDTQAAQASFSGFTLDPNGFTVPTSGQVNGSSDTYVSWNWTAGGPGTINNDGATTSVVSANRAAGFSVVKYVGPLAGSTVGHGLGVQPRMIIQKQYTATSDWYVYFPKNVIDANFNYMELNDTVGIATTTSTNPTTTIINTAASGPIVAYCFADVTNYMKIDIYSGSGVSGKQVTGLGFDPKFVIIKRVNNTDAFSSWYMFDDKRTTGVYSDQLEANSSAVEATGTYVDFITDGFQLDTTASNLNNSGSEFVYIAIA